MRIIYIFLFVIIETVLLNQCNANDLTPDEAADLLGGRKIDQYELREDISEIELLLIQNDSSAKFKKIGDRYKGQDQYKLAYINYMKAASLGNIEAEYQAAFILIKLDDWKTHAKLITELARKEGAENSHFFLDPKIKQAQIQLCNLYREGLGVPTNYLKSYMWCNLAGIDDDPIPKKILRENIEPKLTSQQIIQAQEYSNRCVKQNYNNCDF